MAHPTWLAYSFAVVMVAVSVYCIGRLALANHLGRRNHEDVNISHVLMGLAMVGMLVPRLNVVPDILWEVAFGIIALYFLARSIRFVVRHGLSGTSDDHVHHISHYLIHMVMACAMLYMYWLGNPITVSSGVTMAMSWPSPRCWRSGAHFAADSCLVRFGCLATRHDHPILSLTSDDVEHGRWWRWGRRSRSAPSWRWSSLARPST